MLIFSAARGLSGVTPRIQNLYRRDTKHAETSLDETFLAPSAPQRCDSLLSALDRFCGESHIRPLLYAPCAWQ